MTSHAAKEKLSAPAMVYISGEQMTNETMKMVMDKWVNPYVDTSAWQFFDMSCQKREDTGDQVLKDAIKAGADVGAIFKEPTITATEEQAKEMGLKKGGQKSPNGAMRKGWNGYSIDRETIEVPGLKMGYEKPVFFCRHAVGGEYDAGSKMVGPGTLKTVHTDATGKETIVDERTLTDKLNAAVTYHNPLDNVHQLAHHFFSGALERDLKPTVVTKKTVFKWQEDFWRIMEEVFNRDYKEKFVAAGIMKSGERLNHSLSDNASMQMIDWKEGGFAMTAHNYDGDWLTDEMSKVYKSVAYISSMLTGVKSDGSKIIEFEASHGTAPDQYEKFKKGERTSMNPLGMVHALRGAMDHSVSLAEKSGKIQAVAAAEFRAFTKAMYDSMYEALQDGKRPDERDEETKKIIPGLSTEQFIDEVAARISAKMRVPSNGVAMAATR